MSGPGGREIALAGVIASAVAVAFTGAQVVVDRHQVPMSMLTRDVASIGGLPWYSGFFSNVGIMAWGGAIGIGLLGVTLLWRDPATRSLAITLAGYLALSLLLGFDDMAELHEEIVPDHLGLSERWVFAAEACLLGAWLLTSRTNLLRHAPAVLAASLAGFGVSLAADLVEKTWPMPFLEEGAKLIGILNWVAVGALLLTAGVRKRAPAVPNLPGVI
jgi:hypothetical protein